MKFDIVMTLKCDNYTKLVWSVYKISMRDNNGGKVYFGTKFFENFNDGTKLKYLLFSLMTRQKNAI